MIGFLLRTGVRMLALAGLLYVSFFVPIGPHTLYGHLTRIAATEEAHTLSEAVSTAARRAYAKLAARTDEVGP